MTHPQPQPDCPIAALCPTLTDPSDEAQVMEIDRWFCENREHIHNCQQCCDLSGANARILDAYTDGLPVPEESGFLQEMAENTAIGLAAQFGFHLLWGIKKMVFDSYINESRRISNPPPSTAQPTPKVDPQQEQMQRDIMRIRRSVTGSDKQWPMPGEDKTVV